MNGDAHNESEPMPESAINAEIEAEAEAEEEEFEEQQLKRGNRYQGFFPGEGNLHEGGGL